MISQETFVSISNCETGFAYRATLTELPEVARDIANHPSKYAPYQDGSEEAYYGFLRAMWVDWPDGKSVRLLDMINYPNPDPAKRPPPFKPVEKAFFRPPEKRAEPTHKCPKCGSTNHLSVAVQGLAEVYWGAEGPEFCFDKQPAIEPIAVMHCRSCGCTKFAIKFEDN